VPLTFRSGTEERTVLVRLAGVHGEEELTELLTRRPRREEPPEGPEQPRRPGEPRPERPSLPLPKGEPKPDDQQRPPRPRARRPEPKEAEVPAEIQKLIQPRPGFANYYFNELHRDRVWAASTASSDLAKKSGMWKFAGSLGGGKVEITLGDKSSSGTFPQGTAKLDTDLDLDQQLDPAGSGGLLAALHLWRQILVEGPAKFGDVVYFGAAPHPAVQGQAEILIARRNVAELQLVFDPASGRLAAIELITDPTEDGCDIVFGDYRDVQGCQLPHQLTVCRGDEPFGQIQWDKIELASSSEEQKP
jgi:hypothetical protein